MIHKQESGDREERSAVKRWDEERRDGKDENWSVTRTLQKMEGMRNV